LEGGNELSSRFVKNIQKVISIHRNRCIQQQKMLNVRNGHDMTAVVSSCQGNIQNNK
jgi:hypothetical protein